MLAALRQPRWLVTALLAVVVAVVFVRLGFWQLERLEERRDANATGQARFDAEPVELAALLEEGTDVDSLRYRRVMVTGTWDPAHEVLIRSQVHLGQSGFHVITPLVTEDGWAVLVNRGWVPLNMDQPPVAEPDQAEAEVEGWVNLTQIRQGFGPEDPPGALVVFNRVDIGRIVEQVPYGLAPVYVVAMGDRGSDLPVPLAAPNFEEEGPHLGYAIQWFGFAVIALVGFYFLARREGIKADSRRD
jgi:surfeit locus 1 family protein